MTRKVLKASTCGQMTDPVHGTGNGGDRCTEAVSAMILKTYGQGPWAALTPNAMMYKLTEMLNNGSTSSAPENLGVWLPRFMTQYHITAFHLSNKVWPGFADIVDCIDRGHVAIGGFNDYRMLRLADGNLAWPWALREKPNLGHVLLIVGYDLEKQIVVVHDPLRADPSGQPADYSWKSFQNAVFHDYTEVVGPALPYVENTAAAPTPAATTSTASIGGISMTVPAGWHDSANGDATQLDGILTATNNVQIIKGFRQWVLTHAWDAANLPQGPERVVGSVSPADASLGAGSRQDFLFSSLGWTSVHGVFPIALAHELTLANNAAQTAAADNQTLQATLKQQAAQIAALQASAPAGMSAADTALLQAFQAWQKAKTPTVTTPLPATPAAA